MIRKYLSPRDVQAVRFLTVPLIAAAAIGDAATLALCLAKLSGASISWLAVSIPFLLGLAAMAYLLWQGWALIKARRWLEEVNDRLNADAEEDDRYDDSEAWDAVLENHATEDHEATRN